MHFFTSFTETAITRVEDYTVSPDPGADKHWWQVTGLPDGKVGWCWVAGSVPPPSERWIAAELNRYNNAVERNVFDELLAPDGLHLIHAPRDGQEPD